MLFEVCFNCHEVFTDEGHRCSSSDGNEDESSSGNVLLIRATPAYLSQNYSYITRNENVHKDFHFSVVSSEPECKTTDSEYRTTNTVDSALNLKISNSCFNRYKQAQNVHPDPFVNQVPSLENSEKRSRTSRTIECEPSNSMNLSPQIDMSSLQQRNRIVFPQEFPRNPMQMQLLTNMFTTKYKIGESEQLNQIPNFRSDPFANQCPSFGNLRRSHCDRYATVNIVMIDNLHPTKKIAATSGDISKSDKKGAHDTCKKADTSPNFPEEIDKETDYMISDNDLVSKIKQKFLSVSESQLSDNDLVSKIKQTFLSVSESQFNTNYMRQYRKDYAHVKISDTGMSTGESSNTWDSILSVPGPSGSRENEKVSKLSVEEPKISNQKEMQNLVLKYEKTFTCWVCKKKTDEHPNKDGELNRYLCCVCKYNTNMMYKLQMHSRIHCAKTICKICSKYYTEGDSHEVDRKCIVCEEPFKCKSLLYQHHEQHKKDFDSRCWDCAISIEKHFITTNGKKLFFCCICEFETFYSYKLKAHNYNHRRIVCKICNEKYIERDKKYHDKEFKCDMCGEKFKCKNLLEDHYVNHNSHFKTFCIHCKTNIKDNHGRRKNGILPYKCCGCSRAFDNLQILQRHLYSHAYLKLFTCNACGLRSKSENDLTHHFKNCVSLPKKCEICLARFSDTLTLHTHSEEKHGQL